MPERWLEALLPSLAFGMPFLILIVLPAWAEEHDLRSVMRNRVFGR